MQPTNTPSSLSPIEAKRLSPLSTLHSPLILLDNGHGVDTKGKQSPDGRLREYRWARGCAQLIASKLRSRGLTALLVVPEDTDIPLAERVRRINAYCTRYGASNCLLLSIHNNAAGADGKWHDARGWTGWVYTKSSPQSRRLAQLLFDEARARHLLGNRAIPSAHYWTANYYILRHTLCPAVLTENLFQDNPSDVAYLLTPSGLETLTDLHVSALEKYLG